MHNSTNLKSFLMLYAKLQKGDDLLNKTIDLNISHENFVSYLTAVFSWNVKDDLEYQNAIHSLLTYIPPILLTFGLIGNLLAFIVLVKFVGKFSTYHYLYTLAVMDTLVLLLGLLKIWIKELTGMSIDKHHGVICKLFIFLGYFSSDVSVWLLVAVTVERMILLRSPLTISTICSRRRTKILIVTVLILSAIINFHFFFTVELQVDKTSQKSHISQCAPSLQHENVVNELWPWVDAVIYSFAPFIIISTSNIFSLQSVIGSCKMRSAIPCRQVKLLTKKYQKLTIMMFVLSFSFLALTSPMNVMMILAAFWKKEDRSVHESSAVNLVKTIAELFMYAKHSINFALYFWPGSQFRNQFFQTFCWKRHKRNSSSSRTQSKYVLTDNVPS